jgi:methylated-DNA-[protein]-cysteine S-methyltransferase
MEIYFARLDSPLGALEVVASKYAVHAVRFGEPARAPSPDPPPLLRECVAQLKKYFEGTLREFTVNTEQSGTDFQKLVWKKISMIPFGRTASYLDVARSLGNENALRAVGNANGRNRIPVIVPCHRVVGANDSLTGYAGGLWRKQWLLDHEKAVAHGVRKMF